MKHPLPRIQSAVPQTLHAQLEIAKAIRTLAGHDEDDAQRRRTEIAAVRRDLELLRRDVERFGANVLALAKAELCLVQKYSPDQPRIPKGNPDGGEWTNLDETSRSLKSYFTAPKTASDLMQSFVTMMATSVQFTILRQAAA